MFLKDVMCRVRIHNLDSYWSISERQDIVRKNTQAQLFYFPYQVWLWLNEEHQHWSLLCTCTRDYLQEPNTATEDVISCQKIQNLFLFKHHTLSFSCGSCKKENIALNYRIPLVESLLIFFKWDLCGLWCLFFQKKMTTWESVQYYNFLTKTIKTSDNGYFN